MNRRTTKGSIVAVALVVGFLVLASCGTSADQPQLSASVRAPSAQKARIEGAWPLPSTAVPTTAVPTTAVPTTAVPTTAVPTTAAPTTTTTTVPSAPVDPTSGLSVSGSMGPPWSTTFTVADAKVRAVALYQSPGVPVPGNRTIANPTRERVPLVMLVRKNQRDWLQVQINTRPNGATAWIKASDVSLRFVPNHVRIDLSDRRLTVLHGDTEIWSTSVAPGKAVSPTPVGSFYVDILAKPSNPNGPYGAFQVSVTGFSTVYKSFGSGNGQIAIHGTNNPHLIGQPASHGCVRMTNPDVTHLLDLAPQGTPVDIVA